MILEKSQGQGEIYIMEMQICKQKWGGALGHPLMRDDGRCKDSDPEGSILVHPGGVMWVITFISSV
jgi:hypothetical protein